MAKSKHQRGSFNLEKAVSLSGLMECLVSAETQQNLFDRIDDEDEELADIGLTNNLAIQGINWWTENQALLDHIIEQLIANIEMVSDSVEVNMSEFLRSWTRDTWSDFLRETFDTIWNFGDDSNFEYFFNHGVRQALGYNTSWSSTQSESDDSHANWSPEISVDEWPLLSKVFQAWWARDDVFELFSWVHEATIEGQALFK
jgi:hypothetical protein